MGALHIGHDALIRAAVEASKADHAASHSRVVVSIFVNPAQFEEQHDFDNYPDTFEADAHRCELLGAHCIFAPTPDTVYPGYPDSPLLEEQISLPGACIERGLEDAYRPGHFDGVYRVLKQLFLLTRPSYACFGEKDWQQLILAQHVANELNLRQHDPLSLTIVPVQTQRETQGPLSGIALSSRNVHLTEDDHLAATSLNRAIGHARQAYQSHGDIERAEQEAREIITGSGARIEYLDIRDAQTCGKVTNPHNARILTAARVGTTRLIDNDALIVDRE